jgi:hypothetical protein
MDMRDMPMFTTENGVASLTLNQIPYTKSAWIRIQNSVSPQALLEECIAFCKAVDAEYIYATGDSCCEKYTEHTKILNMQADIEMIGDTDAALFPVNGHTREEWRAIYNDKIKSVPNGAWMTVDRSKDMLEQGSGYFVHRDGSLLGTGMVDGNKLSWVASVQPGAGVDVVRALCHAVTEQTVRLEVASANIKAMQLYQKLGFIPISTISEWYKIL